jgi:hypothetical protein
MRKGGEMKFLRTLLGEQTGCPDPTNWPGDVVPWGRFENDPLRYRFELLMEEYRHCHQDIVNLTNLQSRLENFVILLWVGLFSLTQLPSIIDRLPQISRMPEILLGVSIFLSTFGFSYLMNDIKLSGLWVYLDEDLRSQFEKIVNARSTGQEQVTSPEFSILGYPRHYVSKERGIFAPFYAVLLYFFVYSLMLACMVAYVFLAFRGGFQPTSIEIVLIILNILIFVPIVVGITTTRRNYKSLH